MVGYSISACRMEGAEMKRKQISARLSEDVIRMRDELIDHFQRSQFIGHVTANDVIELAIRELHEKYCSAVKTGEATR